MDKYFATQATNFLQKLEGINANTISSNPLVNDYLTSVLETKKFHLKIYAFVLQNAIETSSNKLSDISLLDFGCGNGLFAIFAKYCGIGKVYGCDIYKEFIEAATILSNTINVAIDGWLVCNEDSLLYTCNTLQLNVIVSTDAIEHIYNLNTFYANIKALNPNMVTALSTGAFYDNYFKRQSFYKLMYNDEYVASTELHATVKDEYAGMAYLTIRQKIIENQFQNLTPTEISTLAKATRGLRKNDIILFVENFLKDGKIINVLANNLHNTCDPITGNFTERILTTKEYTKFYTKNNFALTIKAGFYNAEGSSPKAILQKIINCFITIFKNSFLGRYVAPFILFIGTPKLNKQPI